jgi:hypothetical protein
VPPRELEINVEADGSIGDRFRVRHVRGPQVASVIPGIVLPEKTKKKIQNERGCYIEIVWCFWRDWSDPEKDVWIHVLLVDKVAVHQDKFEGEGCTPLLVARMSPDSDFAWGFGPSIKSLQEYRVLDVITAATQDRVDVAINPADRLSRRRRDRFRRRPGIRQGLSDAPGLRPGCHLAVFRR